MSKRKTTADALALLLGNLRAVNGKYGGEKFAVHLLDSEFRAYRPTERDVRKRLETVLQFGGIERMETCVAVALDIAHDLGLVDRYYEFGSIRVTDAGAEIAGKLKEKRI